MCCCLLPPSNRVLLIGRVVYLLRWRRGASLIQRLSAIDEGADGFWPLASLNPPMENRGGGGNVSDDITA